MDFHVSTIFTLIKLTYFSLWNAMKVVLEVLETMQQVICCSITCKISSLTFLASFVYAFHTIVNQKPLWNNIAKFGLNCSWSWLVLGDFNNVLKFDEICNGVDVTPYEVKDLENCCLSVGLVDMRSTGCFYTWTNNFVWRKLHRAMVNEAWMQGGF